MTVASTDSRKSYAGDGVTTSFDTNPVVFFDSADLTVYVVTTATGAIVATLVENTTYTVTGGAGTTGTISTAGGSAPYGAPASGTTLLIVRELGFVQEADFVNGDPSDAEVAEDSLDKLTMMAQQLDTRLERSVRLDDSDVTGVSMLLPALASRASKYLVFDANGAVSVSTGSGTDTSLRTDLAASGGSALLGFLQAGTGAASRTVQNKDRDIISLKDFGGATGDGVTNDSVGILAADAIGKSIFVPSGTYKGTTVASTDLDGPYWGDGQIKDSAGFKRGKFFSAVKAAPSSLGNEAAGVEQAFKGDWAKGQFPVEHRITGAATAGQPTTGYLYTPEVMPHYTFLYNEAGHNNATASNTGRTGIAAYRTNIYQAGQGDLVAYNASAFVTGAKAASTSYLANPAVCLFNGDMTAGAAGNYLNPREIYLTDAGFDVAAVGDVARFNRTANTGAKSAWWAAYRAQSEGTKEIDVAFSAIGPMNIGLDFSFATFPAAGTYNNAAITLKQNQRIYLNANGVDATGLSRYPSDPLDSYITYKSSLSAVITTVGGSATLQVYSDHAGLDVGKYFSIGANQILSARDTGWTAFSGSASDKATAYDTSTITLPQLAGRVRSLQIALTTHGIIGA